MSAVKREQFAQFPRDISYEFSYNSRTYRSDLPISHLEIHM